MRNKLEPLIRDEERARLRRLGIDRAADPAGYRRADAAWTAAHRQLAAAAREAVRTMGLLRDAGRALQGTGYSVGRIPLEDGVLRLELSGGPESPTDFLYVPVAAGALRTVLDEFHAATGLEVQMPSELRG